LAAPSRESAGLRRRGHQTAIARVQRWLVETKEAHGFYDEAARERMYTRLVAFLHENLN
jgi:hypothetical protein